MQATEASGCVGHWRAPRPRQHKNSVATGTGARAKEPLWIWVLIVTMVIFAGILWMVMSLALFLDLGDYPDVMNMAFAISVFLYAGLEMYIRACTRTRTSQKKRAQIGSADQGEPRQTEAETESVAEKHTRAITATTQYLSTLETLYATRLADLTQPDSTATFDEVLQTRRTLMNIQGALTYILNIKKVE